MEKPAQRRPLEGIPILIKDNIATADAQHTTAGSVALESARAKDDATVVKLLRQAGAVILGKTNLTEFANILAIDMPAGYSSLGGQVKNPYAPEIDEKGVPIVIPGGSRRRRSAPRPLARCCRRRARMALSPSSRRSG
jgi:amidase